MKKKKKKKFILQDFVQFCYAHTSQTFKRSDKNWGNIFDLKKKLMEHNAGPRTARYWISSADYVSCGTEAGLCFMENTVHNIEMHPTWFFEY